MIDLSIFLPAIRTPKWDAMYDSITKSCTKYSWELVMCGPFELTDYLKTKNNVKMIIDLGSPSRCAQLASFECEGKLIYHCVDDALFLENSIDQAIDFYKQKCKHKDVVNMKYREGLNYSGNPMPEAYWIAWFHEPLRLIGIPNHFKISLHHLMDAEYFRELGGYDCEYEYQNFNLHDLMFRLQADGGIIYDSPTDATTCDHFVGSTGDHAPINEADAQHDHPLFRKTYSDPNILQYRKKIDPNNWAQQPAVWTRRFKKGTPKTYQELQNG